MRYDLAVIGGGPAGYSAALEAAGLGLSVVLFEQAEMGGTCLNRGCVPTKFFAHTAELYSQMQNSSAYGIVTADVSVDYAVALKRKQEIVLKLRTGLEQMIQLKKIEVVRQTARVTGIHTVCAGGESYEAENILVATGSVPAEPFVKGAITSDGLLELDHIPKSLKIIGGGVVAAEFAHIFRSFGTEVTVCIRGERILRKWDKELAQGLAQNLKQRGIAILTNCSVEQMEETDGEVTLSAAGRVPRTWGIFEGTMEPELDNGIVTDEFGRTNLPGIFAAGDVTAGSPQLAHVGMEQGKRVARYLAGLPLPAMPATVSCIYTRPEIASVGVTEAEAKEKGKRTVTGKQTMYSNARTLISGGERGFVKLVADADSLELLGAQMMCERASDIAGELALAINRRQTVHDLLQTVHPHPSYCEVVAEAAANLMEKLK